MKGKNKKTNFLLAVFLLSVMGGWAGGVLLAASTESFEKGVVLEKVVCQHATDESYTLYLPSSYNDQQSWPVLFIFDPAGRFTIPFNLFKSAAETYGYILVCPTHVKNGPGEPIVKAMRTVWTDICVRLAVNKDRVYAAGFSGGARMASFFPQAINQPIKGIIACGAGLSQGIQPGQIKTLHYFGLAGYGDMNYREMVILEKSVADQGMFHRFVFFPGKHSWPPEEFCWRGVEWLELMALKTGLIPKDNRQSFMKKTFNNEISLTQTRTQTGESYYAVADYEAIIRLYEGLLPVAEIQRQTQKLRDAKEYKKFLEEEQARLDDEGRSLQKFFNVLGYVNKTNPDTVVLADLKNSMDLPRLVKLLKNKKNRFDTVLAERVLFNLSMKCDADADEYLGNADLKRAALTLDIGIEASVGNMFQPYFLYERGVLYARQGDNKKALKLLQEAVEKGFKNLDYMEKDTHWDGLRNTPQYQQLIQRLKQ